jgi:hypothetical protein
MSIYIILSCIYSINNSVEQRVEWLYAFDIHVNSFFPFFLILYVLQFFLLPFLLLDSIVSTVFANLLYLIAFTVYFYLSFVGYMHLPFLQRTEVFLYPIGVVALLVSLAFVFNVNLSIFTMRLLFDESEA